MTSTTDNGQRLVTRADIESKLREIRGVADDSTEVAQEAAKPVLIALGVAVVIGAFLLAVGGALVWVLRTASKAQKESR